MAFQISGIIQQIGNTESIPYQDKVFKKRELVLDCSYRNQFTGQIERANYPKFEFTGNHVDGLNGFNTGDIVTVSFSLNGSRSEKDGQVRYFTNVQGYKIEKYQSSYNQQQGGNQPTQTVNGNQPTNPQGAGQMSAQQAAMESARNAASASNFPPAVDENGIPIQGNNDDLSF
ncbi:DUF3127 domain-containing protein [Prevotella sp.]|uniref:DUF3127 domain-containing protein n=1 Tax=Prevotella sp. TaxID=59823 RepID=UPI0027E2637B|nr:DUF3127 domain-containing protein [Prevotella sp.]